MGDSPDPVPPDVAPPLRGFGDDQVVPVLVESFSGMFDLFFFLPSLYGNGKINVKLLVKSLLKLFISLSVLLALLLLVMALNYLKNYFFFLPSFVAAFFPNNTNVSTVVQTLLPIIVELA